MRDAPAGSTSKALALIVLALLVLALESGRAFQIDDTIYIRWAQGLAGHGLDPYASEINWFGTNESIATAMRNPPLAPWVLGPLGTLLHWSERLLHLAQLVPSAVFLVATWILARRWCSRPLVALALVAGSPAFLVTGASIMADIWLAAAWAVAVCCWCQPASARSTTLALLALLVAATTKWFGLALVPLLLAWELQQERRLTPRCLGLALPLFSTFALDRWTSAAHGVSIFAEATSIATDAPRSSALLLHSWGGLGFLGGALAGALFVLPFLARTRWRLVVAVVVLACVTAPLVQAKLADWPLAASATSGERWLIVLQFGVWASCGALLLAQALGGLWRGPASARFLGLWAGGTFVFTVYLNWGFPVRNFLPALPALAIVLANALADVPFLARRAGERVLAAALVAGAALGVLLLRADTEFADEARAGASALVRAHAGRPVWFEGHWGFQYYAEAEGAHALDLAHPAAAAGDVLLVPLLNANLAELPADRTRVLERRVVPLRSPFVVLGPRSGAGFWADGMGPLPFAWNLGEVAETWVLELR